MKKLALLLVFALLLTMFAACGKEETPATTTQAADKPATTEAKVTDKKPSTTEPAKTTEEPKPSVIPELADPFAFKVDGDLSEWVGYETITLQGDPEDTANNSGNKKAVFYVALTTEGLYLACDAYHDLRTTGQNDWWLNTNFEFFVGNIYITEPKQYFVYAADNDLGCLTSSNITSAFMKTEVGIDGTEYHTITEAFVEAGVLDDYYQNTINIGVAWKTAKDNIKGGYCNANADKSDEYWVPVEIGWP
ncbi:MAG: hypothetical protein J5850_00525, partial [Clostridia bacterium]|nr:hypothetical protein [Clostridia bacterium]